MVPYPEGALDESGRVRCGGDAIGFWERTVAGKQGEGVGEMERQAEKRVPACPSSAFPFAVSTFKTNSENCRPRHTEQQ